MLYSIPNEQEVAKEVHSVTPGLTTIMFSEQAEQFRLDGPLHPPVHCSWQGWHRRVGWDSYVPVGQLVKQVDMPPDVTLTAAHDKQLVLPGPLQVRH